MKTKVFTEVESEGPLNMTAWQGTELLEQLDENGITVFLKDPQGRYLYMNDSGARVLGLKPFEVIRRTDAELFDPSSGELLRNRDLEALNSTGIKEYDLVAQVQGRWFLHHDAKAALRDGETVLGIVGLSVERSGSRDRAKEELAMQALRTMIAAPVGAYHSLVSAAKKKIVPLKAVPPIDALPVGLN